MMAMAVGLAVGGLTYELAAALPFVVDVAIYALAALSALVVRRPLVRSASTPALLAGGGVVVPPLAARTGPVTLAAGLAAAGGGGVLGVLVLLAVDDLGLGAPAFGFLLVGLAAAATAGALAAPTAGAVLGLRPGAGLALVLSGAGYAAAGVLADAEAPLTAVLALGIGAGAGMVATVLLRALLHASAGRVVEGRDLVAFHLRVWAGVPLGALAAGVTARAVGVPGAVAAAGVLVVVSALTVSTIPAGRGRQGGP